jgi:hypothetical protein
MSLLCFVLLPLAHIPELQDEGQITFDKYLVLFHASGFIFPSICKY